MFLLAFFSLKLILVTLMLSSYSKLNCKQRRNETYWSLVIAENKRTNSNQEVLLHEETIFDILLWRSNISLFLCCEIRLIVLCRVTSLISPVQILPSHSKSHLPSRYILHRNWNETAKCPKKATGKTATQQHSNGRGAEMESSHCQHGKHFASSNFTLSTV